MTIHEQAAQLAPCPFCGGVAVVECDESLGYWIECSKCVTTGPNHNDQRSATEHWNRRAESKAAAAQDVVTATPCAYQNFDYYKDTCTKIATTNRRGYPLCQTCYEKNVAVEVKCDEDAEKFYREQATLAAAPAAQPPCPYIVTSREGTSHCRLAESAQPQAEVPGWAWEDAIVELGEQIWPADAVGNAAHQTLSFIKRRARELAAAQARGEGKSDG